MYYSNQSQQQQQPLRIQPEILHMNIKRGPAMSEHRRGSINTEGMSIGDICGSLCQSRLVRHILSSRIDNLIPFLNFSSQSTSRRSRTTTPFLFCVLLFILYKISFRPPPEFSLDPDKPVKVLILAYPRYVKYE